MKIFSPAHFLHVPFLLILGLLGACSSYEQFAQVSEEYEIPSRVFRSDYNHTWQAVQQVVKNYDLSVMNQSTGVIKSRWIDNTLEINFTDSFSKTDAINAAKFKLIINVIKGYRGQNEVSKVTIFKRQMIEQDPLQGFKIIPTDKILENTLLYRIERVLAIDRKLQEIEKQKAAAAEAADF